MRKKKKEKFFFIYFIILYFLSIPSAMLHYAAIDMLKGSSNCKKEKRKHLPSH